MRLMLIEMFLPLFSETAATNRPLHDRGANELRSHHTRRLGGNGPGIAIGRFFHPLFRMSNQQNVANAGFQSVNLCALL